jgi:hypothetical protein
MTANRTAELMNRLPGWFVEHARRTEEKARRRREALARRYEFLCGEDAAQGRQSPWRHTIVEVAVAQRSPRPEGSAPHRDRSPTDNAASQTVPQDRAVTGTGLAWPEFMTPEELRDLTGRRALSGQIDALKADRIPHKLLRNRLLVSRFHVREWLAERLPARANGAAQPALAS